MNPARRRSYGSGNVFEKSDNIVICSLFDLGNFWNRETRSLANFRRVLLWDLAQLRHRLAGEDFNLQPNLKLPLVRPDLVHFWPGITIDHSPKIKASGEREKRFVYKKIATNKLAERFQDLTVQILSAVSKRGPA